ncbi:MAG: flagellar export protein FliJ [Hydrogenophilaceae bacterium CG1_02_62_390]|nr:MAG: flagellar export protein FliJ [Hydrogenophilaceae bacterium CG1_02_62_390]
MAAGERLLLMIRRKEQAAKLKLEELENYRREYQTRLLGDSQAGMDILMLKDFHAFLGKLEQAIHHQANEVEQQHAHWLAAHQSWLELRRKVKSYEVLEQRHIQVEARIQDRLEQRQSDELSNRKAAVSRLTHMA